MRIPFITFIVGLLLGWYLIARDEPQRLENAPAASVAVAQSKAPAPQGRACQPYVMSEQGMKAAGAHFSDLERWYIDEWHGQYQDRFWLPKGADKFVFVKVAQPRVEMAVAILQQHAGLNNTTARIARHFKDLALCEGVPGGAKQFHFMEKTNAVEVLRKPHLCVSREWPEGVGGQFAYDSQADATYFRALEVPRPYFDGTVVHEFGHALAFRVDGQRAMHPQSVESVGHELDMHWLAAEVHNSASDGQLFALYKEITDCAWKTGEKDFNAALINVTRDDFLAYDEMLGLKGASRGVAKSSGMQFSLGLVMYWNKRIGDADARNRPMAEKANRWFYRQLRKWPPAGR